VVDLGLPDGFGGDLIKQLRVVNAQATAWSSPRARPSELERAAQSGARAVLDKASELDEAVDAVRRLRAGETQR
jgi:DNA-binding NarL/FixJ family response regulator